MKNVKKIAIMGHGVVGSGVAEIFLGNHQNIENKTGISSDIKYILDLRDFPGLSYSDKFIKDFNLIANDDEISVVVETMGGLNPAYTFVKTCLEKGKSVVTSNKELVAEKGAELLSIARSKNVKFLFEASVGGGIPIIRPLSQCLAANNILEINGILNGTTNYILTCMIRDGVSFEDALAQAQKLGYAEKDPSADVLGLDACRKICILASIAFSKHVYPKYAHAEGITKITLKDVEYAKAWGGAIKLVASAKLLENGKVALETSPAFVSSENPLSSVNDVFNAAFIKGDAVGDVMLYGRGAGKEPTASAVLSDVIEALNSTDSGLALNWSDCDYDITEPYENLKNRMYLRVSGSDLCVLDKVFSEREEVGAVCGECAFITPAISYSELAAKTAQLSDLGISVDAAIRVLDI